MILIVIFVSGLFIAASLEKKDYNNGICPKCGHPLRHFDDCLCGDNLWKCDNCNYFTSVSYKRFVYGKRRDLKKCINLKVMAKLTKEEFIAEVKDAAGKLRKAHPELRKGQAIFDVINSDIKYLKAARTTQQQYQIDCFYLDDKIEDFLDKCYEVYSMRYNQMNVL